MQRPKNRHVNIGTLNIDQNTSLNELRSLVSDVEEQVSRLKAEKGCFNIVHVELQKTLNCTGSDRADRILDKTMKVYRLRV